MRRRPRRRRPRRVDGAARRRSGRRWPAADHRARGRRACRSAGDLDAAAAPRARCSGITGTGGSGKSSLTDELVRRFRLDQEDKLRIAVLAVDPTRRRGGGALLGDRIRMNAIDGAAGVLPLAGHPAAASEVPERARRRRSRALQGRRASTWSSSRRPASARATPAIVAARRRVALRDDAGVRRRVAAREDRHARLRRRRGDQQVRAARRRGRAARRAPPARPQPRGVRRRLAGHAGVRHQRRHASTTTASPRSTSTCATCSAERRPAGRRRARCAPVDGQDVARGVDVDRAARPRALPGRDRRDRARLPRRRPQRAGGARAAAPAPARRRGEVLGERRGAPRWTRPSARCRPTAAALLDEWPRTVEAYAGRRAGRHASATASCARR